MGSKELDKSIIAALYEAFPDGILIVDDQGIISSHNRHFVDITEIPHTLLRGPEPGTLVGLEASAIIAAMLESVVNTRAFLARFHLLSAKPDSDDFSEIEFKDGRTLESYSTVLKQSDGVLMGRVWFLRDITPHLQSEESIRKLSLYDRLTGLANRSLLLERMNRAFAASVRNGREGALLLIVLDNLQDINNTAGHETGDLILQETAKRLLACVASTDTVAHLGGNEFVVMLEDLNALPAAAAAQAQVIGDKILAEISRAYPIAQQEYHCTSSIGATVFSEHQHLDEELLKRADIAVAQAKRTAGRNTLLFFNQQMQEAINVWMTLEGDLRRALERQEFHLYFQVQVDSAGAAIGAEALVRWQHPERGLVSPGGFIPAAESTGMILPIGSWVMESACAQLKAWERDASTRELSLSVNVSISQFRQPEFVSQVETAVKRHGINPEHLKLELTESMLVGNVEQAIASIRALKLIGVRFSLDDFGTGYSSLQYLMRLPIDQLKIDQSFIRDLSANKSGLAIVRTIIAMAENLGLDVIAEGVETPEQRQVLLSKGCKMFQGYLFGKPMPIAEFEAALPAGLPAGLQARL